MKKILTPISIFIALLIAGNGQAQVVNLADSTGLAGDNFSLEGALELFKKAKSPEDFERALNSESNSVNNLDLNEDGRTDYIKVKDIGEGQSRVFVMQVDLQENESQDVAVITLEKTGEKSAAIQIKGAEELYGEDKLYEPMEEGVKGGSGGPDAMMETHFIWVNVWYWPCVQFVYAPTYIYWSSPWYWNYYPTWWTPWHVHPWRMHYHACYHYRPHYHRAYEYRNYHGYELYAPRKSTSTSVRNRYEKSGYVSNHNNRTEKPVIGSDRVKSFNKSSNLEHKDTRVNPSTKGNNPANPDVQRQNGATRQEPSRSNRFDKEVSPEKRNNPEINNPDTERRARPAQRTPQPRQPERMERNDQRQDRVTPAPQRQRNTPRTRESANPGRSSQQPKAAPQRNTPTPQRGNTTPQRNTPPERGTSAPAGRSNPQRKG